LATIAGEVFVSMKIETLNGTKPPSIVVFGFDGVNALDLTGPLETFAAARADDAETGHGILYQVRIIGVTGKNFVSESGIVYKTQHMLRDVLAIDTVIVPGGTGPRTGEAHRKIADWLSAREANIRRIVSVCGGIYATARRGLLDGRKVATHWRFVQDVSQRFPRLHVDPAASFVRDGKFYSCGGGTAAIEMTLALIEEDYGSRRALCVARDLVMRLRPPGDKENSIQPLQFECGPIDRFGDLPAWIDSHLNDNLSVEILARRVCLCPRHFSRLFKRIFHTSPASFVEQLRLEEASRRLRLPRNRVDNVARDVGFKSADSFRRAFERRVGVSPTEYRRRFNSVVKGGSPVPRLHELNKTSVAA
jgi:transcriptional regulator GlxA family with amidase domain